MGAISQAFERIPYTAVDAPSTRVRIPSLDGLRGIAILMVIADHSVRAFCQANSAAFPPWMNIGPRGVAIFFALSGYLITSRLKLEYERSGRIDLRAFYTRRFFRLMPAAWIYLAAVWFTAPHWVALPKDLPKPGEIAAALFCFRNYYLGGGSLTGHFWSLSVEEHFYLVWPALFALAGIKRARPIALIGAAVIAVWRGLHWHEYMTGEMTMFYTQYRADMLLAGCFVGIAGLPAIALPALRRIEPVLAWKPLAWVGSISYSLYLWQQMATSSMDSATSAALGMVLLFGFASASFYLVERPLIAMSYRKRASSDSSRKALSTSPAR